MRRRFRLLRRDERGATIIEFAFIAPTMILLIMGLCELTYQSYVQAILTGAMQKAGRDSTIQGATARTTALDNAVMAMVNNVARNAVLQSSTRKSYAQFGYIKPEVFQDNNSNGSYDAATECFTDVNGNRTWDADPGRDGLGGANDVVVYSMTIQYQRLFPMAGLMGWPNTVTLGGSTVLKNQPYAAQSAFTATQVCP